MTDREKFEAWYLSRHPRPVDENPTWANASKADDWEVWTAARADALEYAAKLCDRRVMGDNNREDAEAKRCADAIRAAIGEMT